MLRTALFVLILSALTAPAGQAAEKGSPARTPRLPTTHSSGVRLQQIFVSSSREEQARNAESYRGYYLDFQAMADRENLSRLKKQLEEQIDLVENLGLGQRVLQFFRRIPIVVDEFACLGPSSTDEKQQSKYPVLASACYDRFPPGRGFVTSAAWDQVDEAIVARLGVVMVRPLSLSLQEPTILHELLHAYHNDVLPGGFDNPGVRAQFEQAKGQQAFPADAYLMRNHKEFFAVAGSVFLYGQGDKEPYTRDNLKTKQPDLFRYFGWLFGINPGVSPVGMPIASMK